jgi:hypothetical protein
LPPAIAPWHLQGRFANRPNGPIGFDILPAH